MSVAPSNIVVFWIDEAPREDFLVRLHEAGIQVFMKDNYVDGVQWSAHQRASLVRLKYVQPNKNYTTKKRYPFFAQYDVVMMRV